MGKKGATPAPVTDEEVAERVQLLSSHKPGKFDSMLQENGSLTALNEAVREHMAKKRRARQRGG